MDAESDNKGSANPAETPDIVLPSSTNPKQSVSKRPAQEESETENAAKKSDPNEIADGASGSLSTKYFWFSHKRVSSFYKLLPSPTATCAHCPLNM